MKDGLYLEATWRPTMKILIHLPNWGARPGNRHPIPCSSLTSGRITRMRHQSRLSRDKTQIVKYICGNCFFTSTVVYKLWLKLTQLLPLATQPTASAPARFTVFSVHKGHLIIANLHRSISGILIQLHRESLFFWKRFLIIQAICPEFKFLRGTTILHKE